MHLMVRVTGNMGPLTGRPGVALDKPAFLRIKAGYPAEAR
jgi:hypothetical protein